LTVNENYHWFNISTKAWLEHAVAVG